MKATRATVKRRTGHDRRPALLERAPPVAERDGRARPGHRAEVLALLLEAGAEAGGRGDGAEAAQRVVALLDAAAVLLDAVILVATGTMGRPTGVIALCRGVLSSAVVGDRWWGER